MAPSTHSTTAEKSTVKASEAKLTDVMASLLIIISNQAAQTANITELDKRIAIIENVSY